MSNNRLKNEQALRRPVNDDYFEANLAASDDSTGTKTISLMKKFFDFNKKNFGDQFLITQILTKGFFDHEICDH
ncbi:hypothetical protein BpHYR1_027298 [Brachionus plicatilis]|uniref:Uncharacterized protein n=1 Tax=Brachionus plicatilis TaxID=10195 RepID=A0A3M7Q1E1_BRAPC|nr:hypothetical protein BpHYR1_027298 [Brachionus plicatilis]